MNRYRTTTADSPFTPAVNVTHPPNGATSFTYTDVFARAIDTRTRSFGGGFSQTTTVYDALGRLQSLTAPHPVGPTVLSTSTQYDQIGRARLVTQFLGDIDGTGAPAHSTIATTYLGLTTLTERTVSGEAQQRYERKNALGKVGEVTDALGSDNLLRL